MWTYGLAWLSGLVIGGLAGFVAGLLVAAYIIKRLVGELGMDSDFGITSEDVRKDLFSSLPRAIVLPRRII